MESTTFRKSSDTRALPEVPTEGRKKLTSMMMPTTKSEAPAPTAYTPKLGPTGGQPLTTAQAAVLVKNSFPGERYKIVAPYKTKLIQHIIEHSVNTPANKRRSFETLDRLSKNICSYEVLSGNITRMEDTLKTVKQELPKEQIPEAISVTETGVLKGIAFHIVDGYDFVDESHFIFDKDGNPIDVNPTNRDRKPLCLQKIQADNLRKQQSSQFTKFLKDQSDPYKGSLQGLGRTRKHKKHSKKTLRGRKIRRNVH
jgi:hypothetical protein